MIFQLNKLDRVRCLFCSRSIDCACHLIALVALNHTVRIEKNLVVTIGIFFSVVGHRDIDDERRAILKETFAHPTMAIYIHSDQHLFFTPTEILTCRFVGDAQLSLMRRHFTKQHRAIRHVFNVISDMLIIIEGHIIAFTQTNSDFSGCTTQHHLQHSLIVVVSIVEHYRCRQERTVSAFEECDAVHQEMRWHIDKILSRYMDIIVRLLHTSQFLKTSDVGESACRMRAVGDDIDIILAISNQIVALDTKAYHAF